MLKSFRKIEFVNSAVRSFLIGLGRSIDFVKHRWPISGAVNLNVNDIEFKMYSRCDDSIVNALFYQFDYKEKNDIQLYSRMIGQNDCILDIGANTGLYSLIAASKSASCKVIAFEPNPINTERLKKNIHLNSLKNIEIEKYALGEDDGEIDFFVPKDNEISDTSSAVKEFSELTYGGRKEWKPIKIEQLSIDSYIERKKLEKVSFIKIDVEGYELFVLKGAQHTIRTYQPNLLVEVFLNEENRAFFSNFIQEYQYEIFFVHRNGIQKHRGSLKDKPGFNLLLCPQGRYAEFTPMNKI
ncbi:MAG: FkbM family methyltransferase [Bacteroidota bacterium]